MKALITGATGFVGNHLARLLLSEGMEVWGTALTEYEQMNADLVSKVRLRPCDVRDASKIRSVLTECRPDYIFHLAAQSNVGMSWENPAGTFEVNVMGTIHLLDEVVHLGTNPRVLLVGSAEEYGKVSQEQMPIKETTLLNPGSPYGASKAAVALLFGQYVTKFGLPIVYARAFNHIGPGQAPGFVTVDFAKQIAEIEAGLREPVIEVGNLEAKRDFTDVRDVVAAYWELARKGIPGEIYNVASGEATAIQEILDLMLEMASVKIEVQKDPAKMRPSDVPVMVGDIGKIKAENGWKPGVKMRESLEGILDYWRSVVMA